MCMSIQDMTWQERLRAAAIILRDAIEQQDCEEALRAEEERQRANPASTPRIG